MVERQGTARRQVDGQNASALDNHCTRSVKSSRDLQSSVPVPSDCRVRNVRILLGKVSKAKDWSFSLFLCSFEAMRCSSFGDEKIQLFLVARGRLTLSFRSGDKNSNGDILTSRSCHPRGCDRWRRGDSRHRGAMGSPHPAQHPGV